ncbi:MAG: hypothetical protein ACLPN5_09485 [Roseiarcus sp.]
MFTFAVVCSTSFLTTPAVPASATPFHAPAIVATSTILEQTRAEADRFATLRTRWGPADIIPVAEDTIQFARALVAHLPAGTEPPQLSRSHDGEIGLSWVRGLDRFEAMVQPDGHLVWITKVSGIFAVGLDVPVDSLDGRDEFYAALSKFYE